MLSSQFAMIMFVRQNDLQDVILYKLLSFDFVVPRKREKESFSPWFFSLAYKKFTTSKWIFLWKASNLIFAPTNNEVIKSHTHHTNRDMRVQKWLTRQNFYSWRVHALDLFIWNKQEGEATHNKSQMDIENNCGLFSLRMVCAL